jgi:hypothetical protein
MMRLRTGALSLLAGTAFLASSAAWSKDLPTAVPEQVGLSSERLA